MASRTMASATVYRVRLEKRIMTFDVRNCAQFHDGGLCGTQFINMQCETNGIIRLCRYLDLP